MKIKSGWIAVCATFALAACGQDPTLTDAAGPANPASVAPVPLTPAEVSAYDRELNSMFMKAPAPGQRAARLSSGAALAPINGATSIALARRESDGSTATACLDDRASALQFLTSATPPTDGEVK